MMLVKKMVVNYHYMIEEKLVYLGILFVVDYFDFDIVVDDVVDVVVDVVVDNVIVDLMVVIEEVEY